MIGVAEYVAQIAFALFVGLQAYGSQELVDRIEELLPAALRAGGGEFVENVRVLVDDGYSVAKQLRQPFLLHFSDVDLLERLDQSFQQGSVVLFRENRCDIRFHVAPVSDACMTANAIAGSEYRSGPFFNAHR